MPLIRSNCKIKLLVCRAGIVCCLYSRMKINRESGARVNIPPPLPLFSSHYTNYTAGKQAQFPSYTNTTTYRVIYQHLTKIQYTIYIYYIVYTGSSVFSDNFLIIQCIIIFPFVRSFLPPLLDHCDTSDTKVTQQCHTWSVYTRISLIES